jgi:predicted SnoaL-like aldol condensation-catalyzing enzyme
VHGTALLERNKRNVVGYYTTAFNDKDPELAVQLYGGDQYIQHNSSARAGFRACGTRPVSRACSRAGS